MALQDIRLLRTVINDSLDTLEKLFEKRRLDFPSLDKPYAFDEAEAMTSDPGALRAIDLTVSAAYQLIATVRDPFMSISDAANAHHLSACLRVAEKFNVVEILREAGADGCRVNSVAKQCNAEPTKLARVLRFLATHHILREVTPDTFTNNRISAYLDTGKPSRAIFSDQDSKYIETSGAAAYVGHFTDEVGKASSYLLENLEDPKSGKEFNDNQASLHKAFSMDRNMFAWLEDADNQYRLKRHVACIRGTSLWNPPEAVLRGFDWASLAPDSLVIDVGGGTGLPALLLARGYPHLRIVIQDRETVVDQGIQHWEKVFPEALASGRVSFQVHDFFGPQPQTAASVFFVRTICHDWPDKAAIKILKHLRKAATKSTKLIIADHIIPYACPNPITSDIPGAEARAVPKPLLANLGKASANAYCIDMTMQVLFNGQERTLPHHIEMTARSGWNIIQVHQIENSQFGYLVAEPIPFED